MTIETLRPPVSVQAWLDYDVPEGFRAELVDGELVMTPLAQPTHQIVLQRLIQQIALFMEQCPGIVGFWSSPARFSIPGQEKPRGREPDLGIYASEPVDLDANPGWQDLHPLIVAEVVSPEQAARDYADKRLDYHVARVPEYWIVDFERRLFSALRWTEEGWIDRLIEGAGSYSTPLLPGLTLDTGRLWAQARK